MALDILGPANAPNSVTARPADDRSFGVTDTWFKDCSSSSANDGTKLKSAFMNAVAGFARAIVRMNGNTAAAAPIVAENNADDAMAVKAIQHMIQRGQTVFASDTGVSNHVVVSLTPPLAEYKAGLQVLVSINNSNTGPADININGLGLKAILRRDGSPLQGSDLQGGGALSLLGYDGTQFELLSQLSDRPTLTAARTYYVKATGGSDANDGLTTSTPFATWQHAIDVVAKLNTNGFAVLIQGLGGTYTAGCVASKPFFGGGSVTVQGAGDIISVTSGSCISSIYGAELNVGAFANLQSADSANGAITAQFGGLINIVGGVHLGSCPGYHIGGLDLGQVRLRSNYFVDAGANAHWIATGGGRVAKDTGGPVSVAFATTNFPGGVAFATTLGFMGLVGLTYGGTVSGPRYSVTLNAVISVGGAGASFLPGSTAGSTATGGQYA